MFDAKVTEKNLQAQERKTEELEDLKSRSVYGKVSWEMWDPLRPSNAVPIII